MLLCPPSPPENIAQQKPRSPVGQQPPEAKRGRKSTLQLPARCPRKKPSSKALQPPITCPKKARSAPQNEDFTRRHPDLFQSPSTDARTISQITSQTNVLPASRGNPREIQMTCQSLHQHRTQLTRIFGSIHSGRKILGALPSTRITKLHVTPASKAVMPVATAAPIGPV